MVGRDEVREGMTVRDADGRKLGHVGAVGDTHFEMEPRLLSLKEYLVEFSDVRYEHKGELILERSPHLVRLVDDDGGALPPREHSGLEAEPVNEEEELPAEGP